jgi:hypothetical protein
VPFETSGRFAFKKKQIANERENKKIGKEV